MNVAENFHPSIKPEMFLIVRNLWETHHPWDIADIINTRYSLCGKHELDWRHIENMRQRIGSLDREMMAG